MSVYQVNKLLYLTDNDLAFRKRMMEEPEAVLNEFKLTEEEREALTSGAVGKLYQMGVHTFSAESSVSLRAFRREPG